MGTISDTKEEELFADNDLPNYDSALLRRDGQDRGLNQSSTQDLDMLGDFNATVHGSFFMRVQDDK